MRVCAILLPSRLPRYAGHSTSRDPESRAVQGRRGLRPREGAALRAALVGGGISGTWRCQDCRGAARLPARRRAAGAADQAPAPGRRADAGRGTPPDQSRKRCRRPAKRRASTSSSGRTRASGSTAVKRGLRSILDLLAGAGGGDDFELAPPVAAPARARPTPAARAKPSRGKEPAARHGPRRALPRRAAIDRRRIDASGRSVAWLSRLTGGQEIGSSNLPVPTNFTVFCDASVTRFPLT